MEDATIDHIKNLVEQCATNEGILTVDVKEELSLQNAVAKLEQFDKLQKAVQESIILNGRDSVSKKVLEIMEKSGHTTA